MALGTIADLSSLGLSAEKRAARKLGLGGSDANTLMSGDNEKIARLWETKCGYREEDDLSDVLPVQMGNWTEPFNAAWYQRVTGREIRNRNESVVHPDLPWWRSNLDGISYGLDGIGWLWEAKHVAGREDLHDVIAPRYTPQVFHNMAATGTRTGELSVFEGTQQFHVIRFAWDEDYYHELRNVEEMFWHCVETRSAPAEWHAVQPPEPVTDFRTVNMKEDGVWLALAQTWLQNKSGKEAFDDSTKGIKAKLDPDVGKATGGGIIVSRSKNGALTIKDEVATKKRNSFS